MKRNGDFHSFSTYGGHCSAFFNLYQYYHRVMSAELEREMSSHFKGLQRQVAGAICQGHGQIEVGKDPMSFGLYKQVALAMLQSTSRDMIFARTFMILSWNLMSSAANTVSICYGHLAWRDGALCVYFAHVKNDQRGTRPRDPRHVYSNLIATEIYRYLRHDAAGNMSVGRTVSGLPILQPDFAILPPRFTTSDEEVQRAKEICFPGLPQIVGFVAEFALASLIYHITLDFWLNLL
ncbi:hypothetical protein PHMEG_00020630 [Phytophthora megakarya]|uniref:Uncharacterized protein n=1 Tax=Phytophthora megakarya TaxID=4795 RepID=A0A225VR72_9STRA|nr:hypothetical protein PHMEG_00020630 [Phytophthora megakarya]